MATVSRAVAVDRNFHELVSRRPAAANRRDDLDAPVRDGTGLTAREALELFDAQIESRLLDLLARELKNEQASFYTIGSSGHEGNASASMIAFGPVSSATRRA